MKSALLRLGFVIVLIAVFAGGLLYIHKFHPELSTPAEQKTAKKPTFDFYTMLSSEDGSAPTQHAKPAQPIKHPVTPSHHYVLQVASFKKYQDADDLKAKLLLQGYHADVEKINNHGDHWYRVVIVGFNDADNAKKVQKQLEKQEHRKSLLRKTA